MRIRNLLLLITLFCLTLPATAQAQTRHQRGDWYIGFGLGGGLSADYKIDGDTVTFDDWLKGLDKDSKLSLNFKVGGTIDSKNLLGFDITAVNQTGTAIGVDALIQINNYFLMWTHFPQEEGAFFRLGGGLSHQLVFGERCHQRRARPRPCRRFPTSPSQSGRARRRAGSDPVPTRLRRTRRRAAP